MNSTPRSSSPSLKLSAALGVAFLLASASVVFAAGGGGGGGGGGGSTTSTPSTPAPVDPINKLMSIFDANHDGKFSKAELAQMTKLDSASATQGLIFDANKDGQLDVGEIAKWREYLKANAPKKATTTTTTKGGG